MTDQVEAPEVRPEPASPSGKSNETEALRLRVKELSTALKGFEDAKAEAEAAKLREAGEFDKLLATERGKHTKELKALAAERDAIKGELDGINTQIRSQKFTEAVAQHAGIEQSPRLKALLTLAKAEHGLDVAPAEFDKDYVEGAIAKLKELDPDTFAKRTGAKPLPAGQSYPTVGATAEEKRRAEVKKIAEQGGLGPRRFR